MSNYSESNCFITREFSSYLIICHIISTISIPIDVFCGFVILKHSPETFGAFKWHLFSFHIFASLTDFALSVGTIPLTFLPFMMGYPGGFFPYLGISTVNQLRIVILFFDFTIGSCASLFSYRMYKVTQPWSRFHMKPRTHKAWNILTYTICLLVFIASLPALDYDMDVSGAKVVKEYPCLSDIVNHAGFVILDAEQRRVIAGMTLLVVVLVLALATIAIKLAITFSQLNTSINLSEKTRAMQRKLVVSLIYQITIPFAIIITPILIAIYLGTHRIEGTQIFGNIMFITFSLHGTLSSTAILTMNKPYFNALKRLVRRPIQEPLVYSMQNKAGYSTSMIN